MKISMKKNFKLVLALVLAAMMIASMIPAMADATYTVTINPDTSDTATHEYEAYQIFKGDLDSTQTKLSNITWGDGIDQTKLGALATAIEALRPDKTATGYVALTASSTAAQFAEAMGELYTSAGDSTNEQALADAIAAALSTTTTGTKGAKTVSNLPAGYYFIQDSKNPVGENGAKTRYILQVIKTVTVQEKASVPTITKKVKDINDTTGEESGWQDSADYDIGDSVPYQITATLPSTFADYDYYKTYTIVDTMDAGLTPPAADNVTITIDPTITTAVSDIFQVAVSGQTITISLKTNVDLKTISGITKDTKFVVNYSAVLNKNAKIGKEGNANEVDLEFSNNPNFGGEGTGKTPKDKVIVFTYQPEVDKFNDKNEPLKGAGFTLYKEVAGKTEGGTTTYPTGAQKGSEIKAAYTNPSINATQLENDKYYIVKEMILVNGSETSFFFKGIDDGTYVLVETTIPDGYNAFVSEKIVVGATHDVEAADPKLLTLTADKVFSTIDVDGGTLNGDVINQSGATLPSTGGIGTTIFYVGGSILVLAAAILLITKRRMGSND